MMNELEVADAAAARYAEVEDSTELPRIVHDQASNDASIRGLAAIEAAYDAAVEAAQAATSVHPRDRGRRALARAFAEDGGTFMMSARGDFSRSFFDGDALEYGRLVRDGRVDEAARFRQVLADLFEMRDDA